MAMAMGLAGAFRHVVGLGLLGGAALLAGCASPGTVTTGSTGGGTGTVNFVVTDTPPTGVAVVSFQVQIASAVLQPGSVSILPRPVTVDLAQLETDTGLLASTVIGSGTYTSMTMTLANPQVTLMNTSSAALSLNGQSCAAGATCTYVPVLNNASLTISTGVFPITVTDSGTTGLAMDLSIPDLLQSDFSVTLANGKSVNLSLLNAPPALTGQAAEIDDVLGTVTSVSSSAIGMTTAFGDTLVLTPESTTGYKYPAGVCAASNASCVAVGQIVMTDLSLLGNGGLAVTTLSYAGANGAVLAKALVLGVNTAASTAQVLVQRAINSTALTAGQVATVTVPSASGYAVGTVSYPAVAGASFASSLDLMAGQEVVLGLGTVVAGTAPTAAATTVYLEASQMVGTIAAVNTTGLSVTANSLSGLFTGARPVVSQMLVQTSAATEFAGYSVSSYSGLAAGQFFSAKGPLFNTVGTHTVPTLGAIQMRSRTEGSF